MALQEARSAAARSFEALERVKERALPVRRSPGPAATVDISRVRHPSPAAIVDISRVRISTHSDL